MAPGSGRLMVFDLDSLNQLDRWSHGFRPGTGREDDPAAKARAAVRLSAVGSLTPEGLAWFTGVLRTADLLSDTIIVTDAQLLDGIFFQALGVRRVLDLLGRTDVDPPAITVIGRGPSLEESLREIAVAGDHLSSFRYSTLQSLGVDLAGTTSLDASAIADAEPGKVASALAARLGDLTQVAGGRAYCTELGRAWSGWIDAELRGLVRYERFDRTRAGSFEEIVAQWSRPDVTDAPRPLVDRLATQPNRSEAIRMLEEASARGDLSEGERLQIEGWWELAYADLIATNNQADWIDIFGGRFDGVRVDRPQTSRARTTVLRGAGPEILGEMPRAQYALFLWSSRSVITRWQGTRGQAETEAVAHAIQYAAKDVDLASERAALRTGLIIALGSVIIGFALSLAGQMPYIGWAIPLVILAFTLAVEIYKARAPFREVSASNLRSTLYLRAGASG